jgi:hypothetical protein
VPNTRELLARHAELLNRYGPWSEQERAFVREHEQHQEFVELAETARRLKRALTTILGKDDRS